MGVDIEFEGLVWIVVLLQHLRLGLRPRQIDNMNRQIGTTLILALSAVAWDSVLSKVKSSMRSVTRLDR